MLRLLSGDETAAISLVEPDGHMLEQITLLEELDVDVKFPVINEPNTILGEVLHDKDR